MSACVNSKAIHSKIINNNMDEVMKNNSDSLRLNVNKNNNEPISMHSSYNLKDSNHWDI